MNNNNIEIETEETTSFFEALKLGNITEITKYFRNPKITPWNFLENNEYTGKLFLPL